MLAEEQIDYRKLYHKPETEAEKVLDKILSQVIDDNNPKQREITHYVIDFPGKEWMQKHRPEECKYYSSLITDELAEAIHNVNEEFSKDCKDSDFDGLCGFDFNPITCAQDSPSFYLYQTVKQTKNKAIIHYVWGEGYYDIVQKRKMIKQNNTWKLDGIDCGEGFIKLNMN